PPCRWRRIIGSSLLTAIEKLQKNDCLLHSPAKPLVIPIYAQTYPQNARSFPGSSHSANDLSGIKAGPEFKKKNSRALRKRFRYNVAAK
ncbi:TPA: hypothetical protein ACIT40_004149, partial [Salmonella enterica subsp. enterica serovar Saintpaul]